MFGNGCGLSCAVPVFVQGSNYMIRGENAKTRAQKGTGGGT